MFHRIGAAALKPDLTNTLALCAALGNPQERFKTIHVAGTNGKGSTSHTLAAVLQTAGYKTGLFTSPHLKSFTERIRVSGQPVEEAFVVDFVNRIRAAADTIEPSFFEVTVAMAFDYFAQQQVDVAVIEVGLGGRLDSTNIIMPVLSVITNIGWDHQDILGDTLPKIAAEKAGIIKPAVPVVISQHQPQTDDVFMAKAQRESAPLIFAPDRYSVRVSDASASLDIYRDGVCLFEGVTLDLQGIYQQKNILGALAAVEELQRQGWAITPEHIRRGVGQVMALTGLKGRWQRLGQHPLIVCDTGHNADGIAEVVRQIRLQQYNRLWVVFGVVKDKDIRHVLQLLPKDANYYFCQASVPRALDAEALATQARAEGLQGEVVRDVNEALAQAKANAGPDDMIFVGGSTFVVADLAGI
ncbi:bifunctional folylpolyglutamate synthase/dihydrofolate synthase [Fulvivirgaceae bacterium PWU5]|uniref:Dihydrofolate synthase/folylpolyglutamate synthase n=1 Tax=Dawidia cretensis TaxID=2782350 RepID=A0AAP2E303_9BACT|nr:folylpolyglutamate synthase/dihydrofolate synthase family protein [Dawidia cretensis]MBT1712051.1 bifunctional folylpolyglutamate synthase/dihydrofolate synthase [Dawidia cretensis]